METSHIAQKFVKIGARVKFGQPPAPRWRGATPQVFSIAVAKDRKGEYFDIGVQPDEELSISVLHVRPKDRHLLLLVQGARHPRDIQKSLCGHDERHWFFAGLPEGASTVDGAKEALKPAAVLEAQHQKKVKANKKNKRKTAAFIRQGEFFFVPRPELVVDDWLVVRNIELTGGGRTGHMAEYVYRDPRGPQMSEFGKGRIRHPDHKTVVLPYWHQVLVSREYPTGGSGLAD